MQSHRLRSITLGLVGIMVLLPGLVTAQQGHSPGQATPSASPVADSATEWTVEGIGVVSVDGSPVTMSPDGSLMAGIGPERQLCVWDLAALDTSCEEPSARTINPESITWSPDGTAVAFTEDAFVRAEESDLYVFDLETAASTNLTDDGIEGEFFNSDIDEPIPVDVMPTWALDSQSLLFLRTNYGTESPVTDLMTIARSGGEPELLETVSGKPFAVFTHMHMLADGSLVYTIASADVDDPDSGIWLRTPDGEHSQVMSGSSDSDFPMPVVTDVHEGNGTALVAGYSGVALSQLRMDGPVAFILDIATGDVVPLESEDPVRIIGPTVFSADGATTYSVSLGGEAAALVSIHGGEQELIELEADDESSSTPVRLYVGIEWRDDGLIFVSNSWTPNPYIVTLGA